ncbi:hypothetical protein G3N96_04985 [Burkholderia sp. Se-20373]|uniref:hypothetical protein n=1 Tax=Burkholderia sp. Se-20373 TaxID=2703898 RepID=UPI00198238DC|nr:hypothetical protein [Burkholderia sp. Se-20373]MBN3744791.1 hypothetical protein [Burkholderia sp. Se-20373]
MTTTKLLVGLFSLALCAQAFAADWSAKSIQIEKQYNDGQWGAYDSLLLTENFSIQGHSVGEPDASMRLQPLASDGKVKFARVFNVFCGTREMFHTGFDEAALHAPWSIEIHSPCGTWRYTLVDTTKARHPEIAKGPFRPSIAPQ